MRTINVVVVNSIYYGGYTHSFMIVKRQIVCQISMVHFSMFLSDLDSAIGSFLCAPWFKVHRHSVNITLFILIKHVSHHRCSRSGNL